MTDHIEPALSAEEWAVAAIEGNAALTSETMVPMDIMTEPHLLSLARAGEEVDILAEHAPAVIALLNAMLPAADPRKITPEMLSLFDHCAEWARGEGDENLADRAQAAIHALASYLPPPPA